MKSDPYSGKVRLYEAVVDRLNQPVHAIAYKMVPMEDDARILDVGCGTGAQIERYADAGCVVSGVDLSPSMLDAAKKRLGSDADLQLADATELPYPIDTFDLVTCSMFLHELDPDVRTKVLAEMQRVLKPNGRAVIVEFDSDARKRLTAKIRRAISTLIERVAGTTHYRNFRLFMKAGGVRAALEDRELQIIEARTFSSGDLAIYVVGHS